MKRFLVITAVAAGIVTAGFPEGNADPADHTIVFSESNGLYLNAAPLPADVAEGFLTSFLNLRGAVYGGMHVKLSDLFRVGGEAGISALSISLTANGNSSTYTFLEFPVRAVGSIDLSYLTLQPYVGALFLMSAHQPTGSECSYAFSPAFEAGARLLLGRMSGLYVDGSFVVGSTSFPRFGAGYQILF